MPIRSAPLYAIGTTFSTLTNTRFTLGNDPTVITPGQRIALQGPIEREDSDGFITTQGHVNQDLFFDGVALEDLTNFIESFWGGFLTGSRHAFVSWLDQSNHYSPFSVILRAPQEGTHYDAKLWGDRVTNLRIKGYHFILEYVSVSASFTITPEDRLIYVDTAGGARVLTLPPIASVQPYTVFSAVIAVAGNNLVLQPDGGDGALANIDTLSSITLSTLNQRVDVYATAKGWKQVNYYE